MERLTIRDENVVEGLDEICFKNERDESGAYNIKDIARHGSDERLYNIANKLAAYEDTGLTPERCAELAKAEREGRLVELPCKIGDKVTVEVGHFKHAYIQDTVTQIRTYLFEDNSTGIDVYTTERGARKWGETVFPEDYSPKSESEV